MFNLQKSDDSDGSRTRDAPPPTSTTTTGRHDVDLIGVVGVEVGNDVARVHCVQVDVVVVVIVVIDVVVDVDDQGEDPESKRTKVYGLSPTDDGSACCVTTRYSRGTLVNKWQISFTHLVAAVGCCDGAVDARGVSVTPGFTL